MCTRRKCPEGAEGPDKGSRVEVAGIHHKGAGWGRKGRATSGGQVWVPVGQGAAGRHTKQEEEEGDVAGLAGFKEGGGVRTEAGPHGACLHRGPPAPEPVLLGPLSTFLTIRPHRAGPLTKNKGLSQRAQPG